MSLDPSTIPPAPAENDLVNASLESAETLALLARRRSTKAAHFTEPGPSAAQLDALIRLAARAPDHGKIGPWRFVIFDGEARARGGAALAETVPADAPPEFRAMAGRFFLRAPACVMVVSAAREHPKVPRWEQELSAGAVCYGLLIAAHAMGFAGAWLTEPPSYNPDARAALGLSPEEKIAGFVFLGSAREPATERVRAPIEGRVSRF